MTELELRIVALLVQQNKAIQLLCRDLQPFQGELERMAEKTRLLLAYVEQIRASTK